MTDRRLVLDLGKELRGKAGGTYPLGGGLALALGLLDAVPVRLVRLVVRRVVLRLGHLRSLLLLLLLLRITRGTEDTQRMAGRGLWRRRLIARVRVSHRCSRVRLAAEEGLGFGAMVTRRCCFYRGEGLVFQSPRIDGPGFLSIPGHTTRSPYGK